MDFLITAAVLRKSMPSGHANEKSGVLKDYIKPLA